MPYNAKTDWQYGDTPTENDFNRIEQGIKDTSDAVATKGQPNGLAPLDANSKIPIANLPNIMSAVHGGLVYEHWTRIATVPVADAEKGFSGRFLVHLKKDEITDSKVTILFDISGNSIEDSESYTFNMLNITDGADTPFLTQIRLTYDTTTYALEMYVDGATGSLTVDTTIFNAVGGWEILTPVEGASLGTDVALWANDGLLGTAKGTSYDNSTSGAAATDVQTALDEVFQSVSDGKAIVAAAITDKGIETADDATFQTMADHIEAIVLKDYEVGDVLNATSIRRVGETNEIWSKPFLDRLQDIAVDHDGNVYVVGEYYVRKFNSAGTQMWMNSDVTSGAGIDVDNLGNVYVAQNIDTGKTVRKLDSSGTEVWSKADVPYGRDVVVDCQGNVYVTYFDIYEGTGAIRKLDSSGAEIWSNSNADQVQDVAVDSQGNVYVAHETEENTVRKLNSSGTEIWADSSTAYAMGIAVDHIGNVYATYNGGNNKVYVRKLDSSGTQVWSKINEQYPHRVVTDDIGDIYIAISSNVGKVIKWAYDTEEDDDPVWIDADVPEVSGVAVDHAGNVYTSHIGITATKTIRKLSQTTGYKIIG